MKRNHLLIAVLLCTPTWGHSQQIHNGNDLFRAMHDRYQASWYTTLTFTQKSTTYKEDGTSSAETWYEAASFPGKLRIDIGPASDGNGAILVDGDVTIIRGNKVAGTRHSVNMLLVLGFDVHTQDPAATTKVATGEGYDLSKVREDQWEGKPAYVVGADKSDLKTKQFWVAKDTLLFVRVIEPSPQDATKIDDIRFTNYQRLAGAWIAAGVEVYTDGKKVFSEDYSEIQANMKLPPEVFDPAKFSSTHWEK